MKLKLNNSYNSFPNFKSRCMNEARSFDQQRFNPMNIIASHLVCTIFNECGCEGISCQHTIWKEAQKPWQQIYVLIQLKINYVIFLTTETSCTGGWLYSHSIANLFSLHTCTYENLFLNVLISLVFHREFNSSSGIQNTTRSWSLQMVLVLWP